MKANVVVVVFLAFLCCDGSMAALGDTSTSSGDTSDEKQYIGFGMYSTETACKRKTPKNDLEMVIALRAESMYKCQSLNVSDGNTIVVSSIKAGCDSRNALEWKVYTSADCTGTYEAHDIKGRKKEDDYVLEPCEKKFFNQTVYSSNVSKAEPHTAVTALLALRPELNVLIQGSSSDDSSTAADEELYQRTFCWSGGLEMGLGHRYVEFFKDDHCGEQYELAGASLSNWNQWPDQCRTHGPKVLRYLDRMKHLKGKNEGYDIGNMISGNMHPGSKADRYKCSDPTTLTYTEFSDTECHKPIDGHKLTDVKLDQCVKRGPESKFASVGGNNLLQVLGDSSSSDSDSSSNSSNSSNLIPAPNTTDAPLSHFIHDKICTCVRNVWGECLKCKYGSSAFMGTCVKTDLYVTICGIVIIGICMAINHYSSTESGEESHDDDHGHDKPEADHEEDDGDDSNDDEAENGKDIEARESDANDVTSAADDGADADAADGADADAADGANDADSE